MKKLFAFVLTMLLGATLTFAQAGGSTGSKTEPGKKATAASTTSGKKATKTATKSHSKKGGKKGKKSSGGTTTQPPK
jgi:basic membrane lipoprotein Med (substrate-binding protein (PBP1-ABC) superfamily)